MGDQFDEIDYVAEIKAIYANREMVTAMRRRMGNSGESIDPSVRKKRWQEAVDVFCAEDSDWWTIKEAHGK